MSICGLMMQINDTPTRLLSNCIQWYWLIFGVIAFVLLYLLAPILTPFLIAAALAYLGDPLVDRLEAWKLSRTVSVVIVFTGIFFILLLIFLFLIPILETQISKLISQINPFVQWSTGLLGPYLKDNLGIDIAVLEVGRLTDIISAHWRETGGFIRNTVSTLSKSGQVILTWIANLALIPVITFYLLRDWDRMVAYIDDLVPRSIEPTIAQLARESNDTLSAFMRGQLLVMLALGIIYSVGLSIVGLDFAVLIGMLAGFLSFVPYLGLIVGIGVAGIAVLFQTQDPLNLLWVILVFVLGQVVEGTVLTPNFVGERIGLHPVTVIFAILAGGQLFGFFGVLLALPVAAVLAVIMRHLHDSYKQSQMYRIQAPPASIENGSDI